MEATVLAGEQRLRPIIMTSLAFAAGCLPLALALGAGANARHSIGTGIIGGMIGETTLAMLYVPLLFYLFDRFAEGDDKASAAPPTPPSPPTPSPGASAPAAPASMAPASAAPAPGGGAPRASREDA
jgi:multidrug efflux pump